MKTIKRHEFRVWAGRHTAMRKMWKHVSSAMPIKVIERTVTTFEYSLGDRLKEQLASRFVGHFETWEPSSLGIATMRVDRSSTNKKIYYRISVSTPMNMRDTVVQAAGVGSTVHVEKRLELNLETLLVDRLGHQILPFG